MPKINVLMSVNHVMKDPCEQAHQAYMKRITRRPPNRQDYLSCVETYAQYGNAIPTQECLEQILNRNQSIVELGCGLGYFAHKLAQKGASVTAVDMAPFFSSDNHRDNYEKATGRKLPKSKLYHPIVEQGAMQYLIQNDGCPDSTLLMMLPPTDFASFLWMIDWKTMFLGDAIMFAISDEKDDRSFVRLLLESGSWRVIDSRDVPKYGLATPGTTMKFRTFIRKE